jgi:hypothetical protein
MFVSTLKLSTCGLKIDSRSLVQIATTSSAIPIEDDYEFCSVLRAQSSILSTKGFQATRLVSQCCCFVNSFMLLFFYMQITSRNWPCITLWKLAT